MLDEILGNQKTNKTKNGIGYAQGVLTSKDKGKFVFFFKNLMLLHYSNCS